MVGTRRVIGVADTVYRAALARGWRPPASLPPLPIAQRLRRTGEMMGRQFTITDVERACIALYNAEQEWASLATGAGMSRTWTARAFSRPTKRHRRR